MKYLVYTETFPSYIPGASRQTGIGRYCADLASGLAGLGHEVTVATNQDAGWADGAREPYSMRILGRTPSTRLEVLRRRREILAAVRAGAPDYLLVGDPLAHEVVSLGRTPDVPYCPLLYGTELVAWRRAMADRAWLPGRAVRQWLTLRYLGFAHAAVCISRYTESLLRELSPGAVTGTIVYPSVSDAFLNRPVHTPVVEELRRGWARDGQRPLTLITVARISERKNQLGVLQAVAHLLRTSAMPVHYVMLGNVESSEHHAYFESIRQFIASHEMQDAVTVVGNTTDEQKIDYIDAADVVIMLSRQLGPSVEGFGISVIEGSCRGKPVVVSTHGGMPETIREGVTGFAVPPDDPGRVAEALLALACDPGRRESMGEAGRQFTLERFTPAATAARLHAQLQARQPQGALTA